MQQHAFSSVSLTDVSFLDLTSLSKFAKHYGVDACRMDHEITILRGILFKRDVNDTEVSFDGYRRKLQSVHLVAYVVSRKI